MKSTIAERVKKAVKTSGPDMDADSTIKCIRFTKEMERVGLIRPNDASISPIDGDREQLKLYALNCQIFH
jgi:hypothetical protein